MVKKCASVALLWLWGMTHCNIVSAQEQSTKLPEVVVTASKIEEGVGETTSNVIVVTKDDIEKMNVPFVTDVFREIPTLNLVQNGGAGSNASVFLRGSDSKHVLVLIDGVKANSATFGSFDFSSIPTHDIERIEIVKGAQGTLYGSEAMGGVINVITKRGTGDAKTEITLDGGSYSTYSSAVSVSGATTLADYRMTASHFSTVGFSTARNGTEKDGTENASLTGKIGYRPTEKVDLSFSGSYHFSSVDLDGYTTAPADDPNYIERGSQFAGSLLGKFQASNYWEPQLTLSTYQDTREGRDPDTVFNNYTFVTDRNVADFQNNIFLGEIMVVTAGAEYRSERGENTGAFDVTLSNRAGYLTGKVKLLSERLIMSAGLRYDDNEIAESETTYRLGILTRTADSGLVLRANYGTGFRAPSINELFYPGFGNPGLLPEKSTAWDIGVEKTIGNGLSSLSVSYFEQRFDDMIIYDPLPVNVSRSTIDGVEASGSLRFTNVMRLMAGVTYLDAVNATTGERLTRRPRVKTNVGAEFAVKPFTIVGDYIYVGDRFDTAVDRMLEPYSVVNISVRYAATDRLTVFVRAENVLDESYEEAGGYGTPGLSVYAGLKLASL